MKILKILAGIVAVTVFAIMGYVGICLYIWHRHEAYYDLPPPNDTERLEMFTRFRPALERFVKSDAVTQAREESIPTPFELSALDSFAFYGYALVSGKSKHRQVSLQGRYSRIWMHVYICLYLERGWYSSHAGKRLLD